MKRGNVRIGKSKEDFSESREFFAKLLTGIKKCDK
jgi:hypothetical protein